LNEGERETVIAYEALNPYPLSTLPAVNSHKRTQKKKK